MKHGQTVPCRNRSRRRRLGEENGLPSTALNRCTSKLNVWFENNKIKAKPTENVRIEVLFGS
jgi:hypothetical protein